MTTPSLLLKLGEVALAVLVALLVAYRRYLAQRPTPPRKAEVEFDRQYEPLEPQSGQPDYVRGAADFVIGYRDWALFALLFAAVAIGVFAINEPLVRIISGVTVFVLGAIVVVWRYRHRAG